MMPELSGRCFVFASFMCGGALNVDEILYFTSSFFSAVLALSLWLHKISSGPDGVLPLCLNFIKFVFT